MSEQILTAENVISLPMIPLRGLVIYPHMAIHFDIGRTKSVMALNAAVDNNSCIFLAPQKSAQVNDPKVPDDVLKVGCVAKIKQVIKLPNDNIRVLVEGLYRAELLREVPNESYSEVLIAEARIQPVQPEIFDAYRRRIDEILKEFASLDQKVTKDVLDLIASFDEPEGYVNTVGGILVHSEVDRQRLLEELSQEKRLELLSQILLHEIEIIKIDRKISGRVKSGIEQNQKEYYLREQMKAISEELGEGAEEEIDEYSKKIKALKMPKELEEKALKECARLNKMPSSSPEAANIRTYCDWICDLPWSKATKDNRDLAKASEVLEADHFGLEKVKERILEYIAVIQLTQKIKGPILCFVGPPGVGKTSIAKSIARALGRNFVRMSLGGVKDEAEIRGHRRTYIGAMPGRIIYHMKAAGSVNPVFLLDEIDKMSSDYRGDPASAMLEVLDPEQNNSFRDNYLELPYDLSRVMFICTANTRDTIPAPLLDRMEIIDLNGYTADEKLEIAKKYLVPKQTAEHGLRAGSFTLTDAAILGLIEGYTRESGVRQLEREIANLCRKVVKNIVLNKEEKSYQPVEIGAGQVEEYLGAPKFREEDAVREDEIGAVTGLAWTAVGGTTLTVEVSLMKGKGEIVLTGQLGDVMKESARTALSLVRSHAEEYGIPPEMFLENDIHIHVPEGATPKDGPSAGITMATAILSAFLKRPVDHRVAMTGEITLRGKVLPIGGLKEKTLAAHRAGIKKVILPKENEKDIPELPEKIRAELELIPADNISTVFANALVPA